MQDLLADEAFDHKRVAVIRRFCENTDAEISETCCRSVISMFTFDDGRVEALQTLLPHLPAEFSPTFLAKLVQEMVFDKGRLDMLEAYCRRYSEMPISGAQVIAVLGYFVFEDQRMRGLELMHRDLVLFDDLPSILNAFADNTYRRRAATLLVIPLPPSSSPQAPPRAPPRPQSAFSSSINGYPLFAETVRGPYRTIDATNGGLSVDGVAWQLYEGMWCPPHEIERRRALDESARVETEKAAEFDMASLVGADEKAPASSNSECVVCLENEKRLAMVPCGHRCLCFACAKQLQKPYKCPVCRAAITSALRVFNE